MPWAIIISFCLFLTACPEESNNGGSESVKNRKWTCLLKKDGTGFYVGFETGTPENFIYFGTLFPTEKKCKAEMNRLREEADKL